MEIFIEEGGELIIYAPHLEKISATHGRLIEKSGYAPLETVREMVEYSDELRANLCVAAHLAHVSYGSSRNQQGGIVPRYRITLCSGVPEDVCRRVKLGYLDHQTFRREIYEADPETFVVENAGRDLYLVEPTFSSGAARSKFPPPRQWVDCLDRTYNNVILIPMVGWTRTMHPLP